MPNDRRNFLKQVAGIGACAACSRVAPAQAPAGDPTADPLGVLVDTTLCVGCRKCEAACNEVNDDLPRASPEAFKDESVFQRRRRMDYGTYTVVNRYEGPGGPAYAKFQCMHCLQPACVSACIVGALTRQPNGAVVYDSWKCIGCRYCMVACPFQVPAYEYRNSLTPKVRKCIFCFEKRLVQGGMPACIEACPMQVMTFGRRDEMVRLAKQKLRADPDRYFPHIYGEHEVGGTAWMYLSSTSFQKIDLPALGYHPVPGYTEPVQHMLFKWFLPPLGLYGLLGGIMWFVESRRGKDRAETEGEGADGSH